MINRRHALLAAIAVCVDVHAGDSPPAVKRLPLVALVWTAVPEAEMAGPEPINPHARAIIHGLRDLGLIEGRNVLIQRHSVDGHPELLDTLMRQVVDGGADVIVTWGEGVKAAMRATHQTPIVGLVDDPVGGGFVDDLAHPGGNVTGIGAHGEMDAKVLQLLAEAAPTIRRIAVLAGPPSDTAAVKRRQVMTDHALSALGLELHWFVADSGAALRAAVASIAHEHMEELYAFANSLNFAHRGEIAQWAIAHRLPAVGLPDCPMLLDYTWDYVESARQAARFVKKILDGTKPGDLPFEQPTHRLLTVHLATARAIGLTLPRSLLVRADEVIE
jgi:putative ABC transport system substrate-binding protein